MSITNPDNVVTKQDLADFYQSLLPYLGGMPEMVANKFSKGDLYSTTEKMIGQWVDGKPLYQKTITFTTPSSATSPSFIEVGTIASNIDNIVAYSGAIRGTQYSCPLAYCFDVKATNPIQAGCYIDKSTGKLYLGWSTNSGSYTNMPAHYTVQYTKTTDSAIAIGAETDYSTTEKIVGTWIDGKPLYQRTFTGTTPSTANTNVDVLTLGSHGSMYVKEFSGGIYSGGGCTPFYWYISSTNDTRYHTWGWTYDDNTNVKFRMNVGSESLLNTPFSLTIRYTKS